MRLELTPELIENLTRKFHDGDEVKDIRGNTGIVEQFLGAGKYRVSCISPLYIGRVTVTLSDSTIELA